MHAQVISFNCEIRNQTGQIISSSCNREVLTVTDLNEPTVLNGLNKNLQNLKKGEKRTIQLLAEEAYGVYDLKKVILFPRRKLPKSVKAGQSLQIISKTGVERNYSVLEIHNDFVSLDGNHPLAGQCLTFEIESFEVRRATNEEILAAKNTVAQQQLN